MNYALPQVGKDKGFEERYQIVVGTALKNVPTDGPVLVRPRSKYRGWCWNVYRR